MHLFVCKYFTRFLDSIIKTIPRGALIDPGPIQFICFYEWGLLVLCVFFTLIMNVFCIILSLFKGIGGTARDMYSAATKEHEERGVSGAVGGVLRQLPGTIVKPIILASEATRHVLGGVKNQFVPDARKEASEKWRSANTSERH